MNLNQTRFYYIRNEEDIEFHVKISRNPFYSIVDGQLVLSICYADELEQTDRRICFCQLHFQFNKMEFQSTGLVCDSRKRLIKYFFLQ